MEYALKGLKPERVFYYFEQLCNIPHGSGNTKKISDYCVNFAREHSLECRQDSLGNVILFKPAYKGYEEAPAVMLQGHLDMVAEKEEGCGHDFSKDPLKLLVEDGWIGAEGTTLGGDDGIAVAMCLAILEAGDIPHPALECVFTVDEETGMEGARGIDLSMCSSRYLINLDSEEEGQLLASCAGGVRYTLTLPVRRVRAAGRAVRLTVQGLLGGHSGMEIDKERANANKVMGRLLYEIHSYMEVGVLSLEGGAKDNAIPRMCEAVVLIQEGEEEKLERIVAQTDMELKAEYRSADPGISCTAEFLEVREDNILHFIDGEKLIFLLMQIPDGVVHMSKEISGLVETSLNLGILRLSQDTFAIHTSLRSSVGSRKEILGRQLEYLISFVGGDFDSSGDYPAWEFKPASRLRDRMIQVYGELFGKELKVCAIHAGLECGLLGEKLADMDMVSIGPDMKDIHTPKERLSVASCERTYRFLLKVLEGFKEF